MFFCKGDGRIRYIGGPPTISYHIYYCFYACALRFGHFLRCVWLAVCRPAAAPHRIRFRFSQWLSILFVYPGYEIVDRCRLLADLLVRYYQPRRNKWCPLNTNCSRRNDRASRNGVWGRYTFFLHSFTTAFRNGVWRLYTLLYCTRL